MVPTPAAASRTAFDSEPAGMASAASKSRRHSSGSSGSFVSAEVLHSNGFKHGSISVFGVRDQIDGPTIGVDQRGQARQRSVRSTVLIADEMQRRNQIKGRAQITSHFILAGSEKDSALVTG